MLINVFTRAKTICKGLNWRRNLSLHEYLSAEILNHYGVKTPTGAAAETADSAFKIAQEMGPIEFMVKAQVLAGGRGKGKFENGFQGGVHAASNAEKVKELAFKMLGKKLVTKQTGEKGRICKQVYIVEKKSCLKEMYIAIVMDRSLQKPRIVASSKGGMDIETTAKEYPEAIISMPIDIKNGVSTDMATELAEKMEFSTKAQPKAVEIIKKLWNVFVGTDATQIEINPITETEDHDVVAMDAKLGFDDNAEFRQQAIFSKRDQEQEDPEEVLAGQFGLNFIKLNGSIGCLVNGAGLAMATMDIIKLHGGEPANFLDIGGNASVDSIQKAIEIIAKEQDIKAIFINIFGGIVRCDNVANGLVTVVKDLKIQIPIVIRIRGTKAQEAQNILSQSNLKIFSIPGNKK